MKELPQFVHDSPCCTFVKRGIYHGQPVDWYVCGKTIVYRYGNEPSENGATSLNNIPKGLEIFYSDLIEIYNEAQKRESN